MAFSVAYLVSASQNCSPSACIKQSTCAVDIVLVVALGVLGSLILSGVIPLKAWSVGLGWGSMALSVTIILANSTTVMIIVCCHNQKFREQEQEPEIYQKQREEIVNVPNAPIAKRASNEASKVAYHQILGGLYLGNYMTVTDKVPSIFDAVITVCPTAEFVMADLNISPEKIKHTLGQHGTKEWFYVGRSIGDEKFFWKHLAHDCTFPNSELARQEVSVNVICNNLDQYRKKNEIIDKTDIRLWFEPIFKEYDEAVHKGKKILTHCYAGRSRSAVLIAAYLINRHKVSADEAVAFLRSKRACAEPKMMEELRQYEKDLAAARRNQ